MARVFLQRKIVSAFIGSLWRCPPVSLRNEIPSWHVIHYRTAIPSISHRPPSVETFKTETGAMECVRTSKITGSRREILHYQNARLRDSGAFFCYVPFSSIANSVSVRFAQKLSPKRSPFSSSATASFSRLISSRLHAK